MSTYTTKTHGITVHCPSGCGWTRIYWPTPNKMSAESRAEHGKITHMRRCSKTRALEGRPLR